MSWGVSHLPSKELSLQALRFAVYSLLMEFDWDDEKAAINLADHKVSFDEAKTVFDDPLYIDFYDPDHSYDEHRYLLIGESQQGRLLIVSYTERGDLTRLISAREVTPAERRNVQKYFSILLFDVIASFKPTIAVTCAAKWCPMLPVS